MLWDANQSEVATLCCCPENARTSSGVRNLSRHFRP
jgi:hypothetical protein